MFTSSDSVIRRASALIVGLAIATSACGGSDGESDADSAEENSTAEEADAPADATVETLPAATDPVVTEPPTTTPPVTEAPSTPIGTDSVGTTITQEYCDAVAAAFAPGRAVRFLDGADAVGFEAALRAIDERTQPVRDVAPSSDVDLQVRDLQEALDEAIPIFAEQGFVEFDPSTLADGGVRFEELGVVIQQAGDEFEGTLLDECGLSEQQLDDLGVAFAESVATLPIVSTDDPTTTEAEPEVEAPVSGEVVEITDDSGRITVSVPAEWTDVNGAPGPTEDRVIASTDADAFFASFDVPGMFIEAVDVPEGPTRDQFTQSIVDTISEAYTDVGCVIVNEQPYSDIAYTGTEVLYDCADGFETRLIGGTNSDASRGFAVAMVLEEGDAATRNLIADTFIVG